MADSKLSDLTEITTIETGDLLYITDQGSTAPRKIPVEKLMKEVITTSSDSNYSSGKVIIPGLAGSADIAGAAGAGTSEEWDTSTTGLTWNNTPANVDSDTTVKSHLYVRITSTNTEYMGLKSWSPAGAFDARLCVSGFGCDHYNNAVNNTGLLINDSTDANRLLLGCYYNPSTRAFGQQAYTYASSTYTARGNAWAVTTQSIYLRITRDSGTTCNFFWSDSGKDGSWILMMSYSFSITVAKIGVRLQSNTGGGTMYGIFDWLRTSV